ncbi:hypothetical protein K438DRAFT_1636833 [Mycena galopus ATCC 62051]|nr:hypothetical protein K438DRAFT_1636833 [Mycena galopus ATCC 62051]
MVFLPSLLALYVLPHIRGCISTVSNRTIDDFYGDEVTGVRPVYDPLDAWNVNSNCTGCFVQPDASQTVDGTWHDTTDKATEGPPTHNVTLQFTGTAIYFFGIVPNTIPNTLTLVNVTFSLDGASAGSYTHSAEENSAEILYSVPMFASGGLSNEPHTLVAQTQTSSLLIFDSAVYT